MAEIPTTQVINCIALLSRGGCKHDDDTQAEHHRLNHHINNGCDLNPGGQTDRRRDVSALCFLAQEL